MAWAHPGTFGACFITTPLPAIHAGATRVWQVDTAYMTQFQGTHELVKFRGSKDYFMIAVDVFTRFTRVHPCRTVTAQEAVRWFDSLDVLPKMVDTDGGPEFKGVFQAWMDGKGVQHREKLAADALLDARPHAVTEFFRGRVTRFASAAGGVATGGFARVRLRQGPSFHSCMSFHVETSH